MAVEYADTNAAYFESEGRGKVLLGVVRNGSGELRELSIDASGATRLDKRQVRLLIRWLKQVEKRMTDEPAPKKTGRRRRCESASTT
jgi:hypothetical protein